MTPANPLKGDWNPTSAFSAFATPRPRTTTMTESPPEPEPYLTAPGTHERSAERAIMDVMDACDLAYDRCDTGSGLSARGYLTVARELLENARVALVKPVGRDDR